MQLEFITKQDLQNFKDEIISELSKLIRDKQQKEKREWLKTYEIMSLLDISKSTLHQLRINGTLAYTRIGHCIYYQYSDIVKLMEQNKKQYPKGPGKGTNRYSEIR